MLSEPVCRDRDCVIVGSAPDPVFPDLVFGDAVVLAANGGVRVAKDHGLKTDVLVTTSYLFRGRGLTDAEKMTLEFMAGLSADIVWIDTQCGSVDSALSGLESIRFEHSIHHEVRPVDRSEVVRAVNGYDGDDNGTWVSSGVWAACLAHVSGARAIHLVGISLTRGHEGMPWDNNPRYHVAQDDYCLSCLSSSLESP